MNDDSPQTELKELYVYVAPPIDYWFGWKNLEKVPADAMFPTDTSFSMVYNCPRKEWRDEVDRLLFNGRKYAEQHLGYAGDIDRGPFVSLIPGNGEMLPIVGWVSADRDMTYVASPVPLPHLEALKADVDAIRAAPPVEAIEPFGSSMFRRED